MQKTNPLDSHTRVVFFRVNVICLFFVYILCRIMKQSHSGIVQWLGREILILQTGVQFPLPPPIISPLMRAFLLLGIEPAIAYAIGGSAPLAKRDVQSPFARQSPYRRQLKRTRNYSCPFYYLRNLLFYCFLYICSNIITAKDYNAFRYYHIISFQLCLS